MKKMLHFNYQIINMWNYIIMWLYDNEKIEM
jgi:hypothetical protein